jgi:predicted metalloprotease with PDZ domain
VIADSGFKITHNCDQPPIVSEVDQNGTAEHAGLAAGDAILDLNGSIAFSDMQQQLGAMNPGDTLIVKIHNRGGDHELRWLVQGKDQVSYAVKDLAVVTPEQSSRRDSWLHSDWSKPALIQSGAVRAVGENLP